MYHFYPTGTRGFFLACGRKLRCRPPTLGAARLWRLHRKVSGTQGLSFVICSVTCEVMVFSLLIYRTWNRGLCEWIISWKKDRNQALRLGKEFFNFAVSHSANVFRVDDPRSEPRVLHELLQNKRAEDAESDIAIRFVDKNERFLLKLVQRNKKKKRITLPLLHRANGTAGKSLTHWIFSLDE